MTGILDMFKKKKEVDPEKEKIKKNRLKFWGGFLIMVLNGLTYPLGIKVFSTLDPVWSIFLLGAWLAFAEAMTYEIISRLGAPTPELKKEVADATAISMDNTKQIKAIKLEMEDEEATKKGSKESTEEGTQESTEIIAEESAEEEYEAFKPISDTI